MKVTWCGRREIKERTEIKRHEGYGLKRKRKERRGKRKCFELTGSPAFGK